MITPPSLVNGPVSALDAALRKALSQFYPELNKCHLTDYKVRIIDGTAGTSAVTRVLVESSNGLHRWTTIGVSDNILEASYQAVAQGIEYGLLVKSPQTCSLVDHFSSILTSSSHSFDLIEDIKSTKRIS